jgi:hypothetical protein
MNVIIVPVVLGVAVWLLQACMQISRPSPRALGTILGKLCVVSLEEIERYCEIKDRVWQKQLRVVWGYVRAMVVNTTLFQQVARFEKMKIDPAKSSLDYKQRETLILELVDETAGFRWLLVRVEIILIFRTILMWKHNQRALETMRRLVVEYKQLEQDIVALAGMADDDCYSNMLMERLGLNWGLHRGAGVTAD